MRHRYVWLLTALWCGLAAGAEAGTWVEATGCARVEPGAEARAADLALADAQRLAVERGAGVYLSARTTVGELKLLRDELATRTAGFLASYDVVRRERVGDELRVTVRALVKTDALAAELLDLAVVNARLNRPRLLVVCAEQEAGAPSGRAVAARELQRLLLSKGCEVVERPATPALLAGEPAAVRAAAAQGVDVVVAARANARRVADVLPGVPTFAGSLEARVYTTANGRLLAAGSVELPTDPSRRAASGLDPAAAAATALRRLAGRLLLGDGPSTDPHALLAQLLERWLHDDCLLVVELAGATPAQRPALLAALSALRPVRQVLERGSSGGLWRLEVSGLAPLRVLTEALATVVRVTAVDGQRVTGEVPPAAPPLAPPPAPP